MEVDRLSSTSLLSDYGRLEVFGVTTIHSPGIQNIQSREMRRLSIAISGLGRKRRCIVRLICHVLCTTISMSMNNNNNIHVHPCEENIQAAKWCYRLF